MTSHTTISYSQAIYRHPDSHIEIIDRSHATGVDQAIYVWENKDDSVNDDGSKCIAIYWMIALPKGEK